MLHLELFSCTMHHDSLCKCKSLPLNTSFECFILGASSTSCSGLSPSSIGLLQSPPNLSSYNTFPRMSLDFNMRLEPVFISCIILDNIDADKYLHTWLWVPYHFFRARKNGIFNFVNILTLFSHVGRWCSVGIMICIGPGSNALQSRCYVNIHLEGNYLFYYLHLLVLPGAMFISNVGNDKYLNEISKRLSLSRLIFLLIYCFNKYLVMIYFKWKQSQRKE